MSDEEELVSYRTFLMKKQPPLDYDTILKLIGGQIGTLCALGKYEDVRQAIQFWATSDAAWETFNRIAIERMKRK